MYHTHQYLKDLNAPDPDLSRIKINGLPLNWRRVGLHGDTWTANSHFMGCYEVRKVAKKGWCWMNPTTKQYVQCLGLEAGQKASQKHHDDFTASQVILSFRPEGIRVRVDVGYYLYALGVIEVDDVSLHAEIDNPKHPISSLCTGKLGRAHWHWLGGREAIETECRERGSHNETDDEWNYKTEDEQDFYSIQNRNQ